MEAFGGLSDRDGHFSNDNMTTKYFRYDQYDSVTTETVPLAIETDLTSSVKENMDCTLGNKQEHNKVLENEGYRYTNSASLENSAPSQSFIFVNKIKTEPQETSSTECAPASFFKTFRCGVCHADFSDMSVLKALKTHHCKKEGRGVPLKPLFTNALKPVKVIQLPEITFKCRICNIKFDNDAQLKFHNETRRQYKCSVCFGLFDEQAAVQKHMAPMHKGVKDKSYLLIHVIKDSRPRKQASLDFRQHCNLCGQFCYDTDRLFNHMTNAHKGIGNLTKRQIYSHPKSECNSCNCMFENGTSLKAHMALMHEFFCEDCGLVFETSEALERHVPNVDARSVYRHTCKECGASYQDYASLETHVRERHHNSRSGSQSTVIVQEEECEKFTCSLCNCSFRSLGSLSSHLRTHSKVV